jgi:hypothetical protein
MVQFMFQSYILNDLLHFFALSKSLQMNLKESPAATRGVSSSYTSAAAQDAKSISTRWRSEPKSSAS